MLWGKVRSLATIAAFALATDSADRLFAQAIAGNTQPGYSRVDIYAGYGWFHPLNSGINGKQYQDVTNPNATGSISVYFNRFVGVQLEGGYFSGSGEHRLYDSGCTRSMCDQLVYTAQGGPILRLPLGRFVPFVHALGGGERTNGPVDQSLMWGWGVTGGVGADYILPFFHNHLAVRPIQADYQYSQVVYGPLHLPEAKIGGFGEITALKLSGGITFRLGDLKEKPPLAVGCVAEPIAVYAGEPVSISGQTTGLDTRRPAYWKWEANGGVLQPHGSALNIDTTGLSAGEYTVRGHLSQGPKASQQGTCEVPFTVHTHETMAEPKAAPLTVTCSANPTSVTSGTSVDINAAGTSLTNRPLVYSYSTTSGIISGNGPSARLGTAGLAEGPVTVACHIADDQGQQASATTTVEISNVAAPEIPNTQTMCSLNFLRDKRRPARVDNEAKACLDDIALTLGQSPDSHLVMVGNTSPDEAATVAAERVMNARQYLVREKGIDASRIELRVGSTSGRTADEVLVPSGASYVNENTQSFDENAIQRHGEAYGIHHGSAAPILVTSTTRRKPVHRAAPRRNTHRNTTTYTGAGKPSTAPGPNIHAEPTAQRPQDMSGSPVTSIPPLQ